MISVRQFFFIFFILVLMTTITIFLLHIIIRYNYFIWMNLFLVLPFKKIPEYFIKKITKMIWIPFLENLVWILFFYPFFNFEYIHMLFNY